MKGINPNLRLQTKKNRSIEEYVEGIVGGDRVILAEAITLIESLQVDHMGKGHEVLCRAVAHRDRSESIRIGITGSPGSGKSTTIEALGLWLIELGHRVAVLAVDPSSSRTQGSILGDKTRMERLSTHEAAYVRPTPSANILGGVAGSTRESIALCEAAGYDIILIESVGVGQSETSLADIVDLMVLLLLPGGGDGIQGIKRGIMEMADIIAVNKCDGDQAKIAQRSIKAFRDSMRFFRHELSSWAVTVTPISALQSLGIDELWSQVEAFVEAGRAVDFFAKKRIQQDRRWLQDKTRRLQTHLASQILQLPEDYAEGGATDRHIFDRYWTTAAHIYKRYEVLKKIVEKGQ